MYTVELIQDRGGGYIYIIHEGNIEKMIDIQTLDESKYILRVDVDCNGKIKHNFGNQLVCSGDDKEKAQKCQEIINTYLALLNAEAMKKSTDKFRRVPEILNISILMSTICYGQQDFLENHVGLIPHCHFHKIYHFIKWSG